MFIPLKSARFISSRFIPCSFKYLTESTVEVGNTAMSFVFPDLLAVSDNFMFGHTCKNIKRLV